MGTCKVGIYKTDSKPRDTIPGDSKHLMIAFYAKLKTLLEGRQSRKKDIITDRSESGYDK